MIDQPGNDPEDTSFSNAEETANLDAGDGASSQAELNAELGLEAVMDNARPYFQQLIDQLKEPLQKGEYDSILGDDVTGRILALAVGEVASLLDDDADRPHPARLFYAGGSPGYATISQAIILAKALETGEPQYNAVGMRKVTGLDREQRDEYRDQQLDAYLGHIQPQLGKRTLLVTDHIWRGRTVDRVARALHKRGVVFDIATLGTNGDPQAFINGRADRAEYQGVKWYSGGDQSEQGVLYSRDNEADELDENKFRQQIGTEKDWLDPVAKRGEDFDGAAVSAARAYLADYSRELYEGIADN